MNDSLREVAEWLVTDGYPFDFMTVSKPPEALCQVLIDVIHEDKNGTIHGNELDRDSAEAWIAEEAGWDEGPLTAREGGA